MSDVSLTPSSDDQSGEPSSSNPARITVGRKRNLRQRPGVIASTIWAVLAFYGVQIILGIALSGFGVSFLQGNLDLFIVEGVAQGLSIAALMVILRRYKLSFESLGLRRGRIFGHGGLIALVFVAYLIGAALLTNFVHAIFTVDLDQAQDIGFTQPGSIGELLLVFVALVVVAPFVEELLFRGLLFRAYRQRFGFIGGALLVSTLFAAAHAQWNVALDVFVLSLAACYLREKTDSLWPAIWLHATKNFLAFGVLFLVPAASLVK